MSQTIQTLQADIQDLPDYNLKGRDGVDKILRTIQTKSSIKEVMFFLSVLRSHLIFNCRKSKTQNVYLDKVQSIIVAYKSFENVKPIKSLKVGESVGFDGKIQRVVKANSEEVILLDREGREHVMKGFGLEGNLRVLS
jgi:hypothetical protein